MNLARHKIDSIFNKYIVKNKLLIVKIEEFDFF